MSIATRIQLRLNSIDGPIMADLTAFATACEWSNAVHGPRALSLSAPRLLVESFAIYAAQGLIYVVAMRGLKRIWLGRLSDPGLWANAEGSGVVIRALGLWEALNDVRYTALWSDTRYEQWIQFPDTSDLLDVSMRFEQDKTNRLYCSPKKGDSFPQFGGFIWRYETPHLSARAITALTCSYAFIAPAGWRFSVRNKNSGSLLSDTTTIDATGSLLTGTISTTQPAGTNQINVLLYWNSAGNTTITSETGDWYLRLTNIRVTTAPTITADAITGDVLTKQLLIAAGTLQNPGLDFTDLVFEDAPGIEAIERVVSEGDGIGTPYVARVDANGKLHLEPFGAYGRTWYVDLTDLELAQDRATLANAAYSVYKDANGRVLRTTTATNNNSVVEYGYTRTEAVDANTTSSTIAGQYRDAYLSDNNVIRPAAAIAFDAVYTATGGRESLTEVLPGDTIVVRNLPLAFGNTTTLDRVRSFRITETTYDAIEDRLTVTPETPIPSLDVLIAQQARPGKPARGGIGRPLERRAID